MHKIIYAIAWCFSLLPLQVLYLFADCGYVLIYHIARYRRKLAYNNIRESFPEKTKEECQRITKKFYRHFCNMFVETIKTLTMSDKEMAKRFVFENADIIDGYYEQNKSLILTLGHYGNWEINKLSCATDHADREGCFAALEEYYTYLIHNSAVVEMVPKGHTKASGIGKMCEALGIDRADTFAVGDSVNDLAMLEYAGVGIAMGNGSTEAKAAADYVTADLQDDGIYRAMLHFKLI